jgi:LPPG:FO 2-phospho-L-lactate transferase
MLTVLSGGSGTPKLLQGLVRLVPEEELSIIVNTADDVEISGVRVSPDLDRVVYTLAGIINEKTWYGIRGDTFFQHEELVRRGRPELLRIGDRDREVMLRRTKLLQAGKTLSEVTLEFCGEFGVKAKVLPMSDDRVQTRVYTEAGSMDFQEFWVARRARDRVTGVSLEGIENAKPAPGVVEALESSEVVIIGPSNPVTSIGPIVGIEEIREILSRRKDRVVAISPIVGRSPVSGPAGVLMRGLGVGVSPVGVAKMYRGIVGTLVIDKSDENLANKIDFMKTELADILMPNLDRRVELARGILRLAERIQNP